MASQIRIADVFPAEAEFFEAPSRDDRSPTGDGDLDGPLCNGMVQEVMALLSELKRRREHLGLSLATLAKRSRLSVAAIEQLESRQNLNPRFDLVWRYALAMDALPTLVIEDVEPGPEEIEERAREVKSAGPASPPPAGG